LKVDYFLHEAGYNYFNMNALTPKEIRQLIDGQIILYSKDGSGTIIGDNNG